MFPRTAGSKLFSVCFAVLMLPARGQDQVAAGNNDHLHLTVECNLCHQLNGSQPVETPSEKAAEKCNTCHCRVSAPEEALSDLFHQSNDHDCLDCHRFHQPSLLLVKNDTTFLEIVQTERGICRDCHRSQQLPEVSAGHRLAWKLAHSNRDGRFFNAPSQFCMVCHEDDNGQDMFTVMSVDPPSIDPLGSHPFGIPFNPGSRSSSSLIPMRREIDAKIVIVDGHLECQSCHTLLSKSRHLLLVSGNMRDLCVGCHRLDSD